MERALTNIEQVDVREMDREELITFFYQYINTSEYLERHHSAISKKIRENKKARTNDLSELDRKYDSFYFQNLCLNEAEAKEKLADRNTFRNKILSLNISIPIFIKILFLFGAFVFFRMNQSVTLGAIMIDVLLFVVSIGLVLVLATPLFFILSFLFYPIFELLYIIVREVPENFISAFISFIDKIYTKNMLKKARKKDLLAAESKGISKENIREVFQYNQIREEIDYKYNELENKIRSWNFDVRNKNEIQHRQLDEKFPIKNQELGYIIYMYNQLIIGANDNWKESVNDLKLQLRHDELINDLREFSNNVIQSNKELVRMNQDLDRRISSLDQTITQENDRLNARMDGYFQHLEYYGYYY